MDASTHSVIKEAMRIGGRKVDTSDVIEIRYPYTNEVIGTVPAGDAEHAREAFQIAANYTPKLTRYERQQILFRAAELIRERREQIAEVLTLELGICKQHSLPMGAMQFVRELVLSYFECFRSNSPPHARISFAAV